MAFFFRKDKETRRAEKVQKQAEYVHANLPTRSPVIGLALSGGGARGFAHIGVLKAFCEAGLKFDIIAGTSAGSIVGALYSFGLPFEKMEEASENIKVEDVRDSTFIFSTSNASNIEGILRNYIGDAMFSDLRIPFVAVACDLVTGKEVHLDRGSVARAVSASCCVPGIFKPVIWEDKHLIDGGIKNVLPADVARERGADFVVSVEVNSARGIGTDSLKTLDVFKAAMRMSLAGNGKIGLINSDIVIFPDISKYKSTSKQGYREMIAEGYRAAKEALPEILKLYEKRITVHVIKDWEVKHGAVRKIWGKQKERTEQEEKEK